MGRRRPRRWPRVVRTGGAGRERRPTLVRRRRRGRSGVDDITVSEPAALRRARAEAVGAARSLVPVALELPAMPNDVVEDPYDVALECSGRADAMEMALAQLVPAGRLVLVGAGVKPP